MHTIAVSWPTTVSSKVPWKTGAGIGIQSQTHSYSSSMREGGNRQWLEDKFLFQFSRWKSLPLHKYILVPVPGRHSTMSLPGWALRLQWQKCYLPSPARASDGSMQCKMAKGIKNPDGLGGERKEDDFYVLPQNPIWREISYMKIWAKAWKGIKASHNQGN